MQQYKKVVRLDYHPINTIFATGHCAEHVLSGMVYLPQSIFKWPILLNWGICLNFLTVCSVLVPCAPAHAAWLQKKASLCICYALSNTTKEMIKKQLKFESFLMPSNHHLISTSDLMAETSIFVVKRMHIGCR